MIMVDKLIMQIDGATKMYGTFAAAEDINFTVKKGEIIGLVGLNGAGKSTLINMMLGFLRPSRGKIEIFGQQILPETAHLSHKNIGFATGDMSLFSNLTGKQYFAFLLRSYRSPNDKRLKELCTQFDPQMDKKIKVLSRGNKQKIALIAAFMTRPEFVILDEPSSGLDPLMQQTFLDLIREEGKRGTTIFMSSHYLKEVTDVCSRVLFMRNGKLVKDVSEKQLEGVNGKAVRVVCGHPIKPPQESEQIERHRIADGYELKFIYKDSSVKLQQWIKTLPLLVDFSVIEHDIESAFGDIYIGEDTRERHV